MVASKTALTVGSVTLALLFGGGIYLYMNLNMIAERLAERIASQTLKVDVEIGSVDISFQEKKVSVHKITVANPPGYKNAKAVTIDLMSIQAETLSQELLNFSNAQLKGMTVNLEVTPKGTNLSDIQKNINIPANNKSAKEDQAAVTKVMLKNFIAEGATINPSVTLLETQDLQPVTIPDIHLKDIGTRENGVTAQKAVARIWQEVSKKSLNTANSQGLLKGLDGDALKDAGISQVKQIKTQVKEQINNTIENVKGLFGR